MAFGDADASSPAFASVNTNWTTTGATSASFTPPAGSLVVLAVYADTSSGANPGNETVTDSGGGAAWQFKIRRAKPDSGSQAGNVAWWEKAFAAAPGSPITVTVVGNATGGASGGFKAHVVAGCSGSEGHAEGSSTAAVVSLVITSSTNNARGIVMATDWNVQANMTAGASQTALLASSVGSGPDTRVYLGIQNAVTSPAGNATMSTASPSAGNANNFVGGFLVPSAGGTQNVSATLTGTATITPATALDKPVTSTLTGTATISPAVALTKTPSATLTATATISPAVAVDKPTTSTLTSTATITPAAALTKPADASLTAATAIDPAVALTKPTDATLTATASISAALAVTAAGVQSVSATLTATATISAVLTVTTPSTGLGGNAHGPLPLAPGAVTTDAVSIAGTRGPSPLVPGAVTVHTVSIAGAINN